MAYASKDYTNFGLHGSSMMAEKESDKDGVQDPGFQSIAEAVGGFSNIFLKVTNE